MAATCELPLIGRAPRGGTSHRHPGQLEPAGQKTGVKRRASPAVPTPQSEAQGGRRGQACLPAEAWLGSGGPAGVSLPSPRVLEQLARETRKDSAAELTPGSRHRAPCGSGGAASARSSDLRVAATQPGTRSHLCDAKPRPPRALPGDGAQPSSAAPLPTRAPQLLRAFEPRWSSETRGGGEGESRLSRSRSRGFMRWPWKRPGRLPSLLVPSPERKVERPAGDQGRTESPGLVNSWAPSQLFLLQYLAKGSQEKFPYPSADSFHHL
ncbi:uncharacterized protein LOC129008643 [Pongo pygmaeus]|uniref:uncharacterized protein LOC129008643 n=1 Tax=Pongo pygmaeus TaxID=9600 RepID=UPI0023E1437D|nr:uncharacterized protein LOC129008643 [Pongo pygmaeus]XP_054381461.1 uncharacterized protein LOC103891851 [Pongo abelii]